MPVHKQVLNRERIEQDIQETDLDNQVGEAVEGDSPTTKEESRTKEEKMKQNRKRDWRKKKS